MDIVYPAAFPSDFVNDVRGWAFDEDTIRLNAGRLLTLDIDFGSGCSLNCPFCFTRGRVNVNGASELAFSDYVRIIREAKELGLRSVKIVGAGEPLEEPLFIDLLALLKDYNVIPLIFTKANSLCDDDFVSSTFGKHGLSTGLQLIRYLYSAGASLIVSLNSFDGSLQDVMVGGCPGYSLRRAQALEVLAAEGFNSTNPTRLAVGVNPVTVWNIAGAYDIYVWARERNIYPIVTPSMVAGLAKSIIKDINPPDAELIELYSRIYSFNLARGLQTGAQLEREGISSYAGAHPCNQVGCGLYITLSGEVYSCPGSDSKSEGNTKNTPLDVIWHSSENYNSRSGLYNCRCIAKDGMTLPIEVYFTIPIEAITNER